MAATPETKAKRIVDGLLKMFGTYYICPATGGFGASGAPDRVGCQHGIFFGVEIKADTEVTALQQSHLDRITKAGGMAFVVRIPSKGEASGLVELQRFLEGST